MNKTVLVRTDETGRHFIKNGSEKLWLQEIKNVLIPKELVGIKRQIEFAKRKSRSFEQVMQRKVMIINQKVVAINRLGHKLKPLEMTF